MSDVDRLRAAIDARDTWGVRGMVVDVPSLLEATDRYGLTPLMYAALSERRSVEVVSALIDAGADVNAQSSDGYTALHYAIDVGGTAILSAEQIISALVFGGADLERRQKYGWTALLCAVVRNRPVEVGCLLTVGAQPNTTLPRDSVPAFCAGRTVLMAALANSECEEILATLLRFGADPYLRDEHGLDFFAYAAVLRKGWGEWHFRGMVDRGEALVRAWVDGEAGTSAGCNDDVQTSSCPQQLKLAD